MNYLRLPWMDDAVSVFDICHAHQQLEGDYNSNGWLHERPSNKRRRESTSCQLLRMKYNDPYRWVDIYCESHEFDDPGDEDVRDIYILNVLKLGFPTTVEERAFIRKRYTSDFLAQFPTMQEVTS